MRVSRAPCLLPDPPTVTRWAFVSDIHGNRSALSQVEAAASTLGVERYVCLGDVIGRGDPDGCVQWVAEHATHALIGNRDVDYLERISPPLRDIVVGWLREVRDSDFIASHGDKGLHRVLHSGGERDGFTRATDLMAERGARLWLFGHTHRARAWEVVEGRAVGVDAERIELDQQYRYIVNVGTAGLPLPGRGGPSFTVYDDDIGSLDLVPLKVNSRAPSLLPYSR